MTLQTQAQKLSELISDVKQVKATTNNIEKSLAVHEQRHIALDNEHTGMLGLLSEHGKRLSDVERDNGQNKRDIERLAALAEKLTWAFAGPAIAAVVGAIVWALSQVAK
jgi:uncharacterized linocin/CFP29 family protein